MTDYKNKIIAVVGVSENPLKYGHRIFVDMARAGWQVYGINPKGGEIEITGQTVKVDHGSSQVHESSPDQEGSRRKLLSSLANVPEKPDIVVTVVPPEVTEQVVQEAHNLGFTTIWMQPGSESEQAVQKAKDLGMEVTYNKCIMQESGLW